MCAVERADARVALLATAQDGVVSRGQALVLSLSAREIQRRLEARRWHLLHRGVYAIGHEALTLRARAIAALLAAPDGALLSHRTAAAHYGIWPGDPPPEVTVGAGRSRNRATLIAHGTRTPPAARIHRGLPCTTPERTCVDLFTIVPSGEATAAIREARVAGLVTQASLEHEAERRGAGAAAVRRALAGGAEPTRSRTERSFLRLLEAASLPPPLVNEPISGHRVDFHWPAERLIVETDAFSTHGDRRTFESDRARDVRLQLRGWRVLRFTRTQIRDEPLRVVAALARALSH